MIYKYLFEVYLIICEFLPEFNLISLKLIKVYMAGLWANMTFKYKLNGVGLYLEKVTLYEIRFVEF